MPRPNGKIQRAFDLSPDLARRLRVMSAERGESQSTIVERALRREIEGIAYTPASFAERMAAWLRHAETSPLTCPQRTPEEIAERRIHPMERVAMALLERTHGIHPLVEAWRRRLVADTTCADWMPRELMPDEREALEADEWGPLTDNEGNLVYRGDMPEWARQNDRALHRLLHALVMHRLHGEEGGEEEGLGSDSLACAVVGYALSLPGIEAAKREWLREEG